jgi:hypothetical protein
MIRRPLKPGIYSAIVMARSTDSPAREILYTVVLQIPGASQIEFVDIAPYPAKRLSRQDDTLELVPFELGETGSLCMRLAATSNHDRDYIGEGEQPHLGPCTQGGTP